MARFIAGDTLISIPGGISTLYLDTASERLKRSDHLQGQFAGGIKIDSIVRNDTTYSITDSTFLKGIHIYSSELQSIFTTYNVYLVGRRFRDAFPHDTVIWDRVRGKQHVIPDLSEDYYIAFDTNMTSDTVIAHLKKVQGLWNIGPLEDPVPDGFFDTVNPTPQPRGE